MGTKVKTDIIVFFTAETCLLVPNLGFKGLIQVFPANTTFLKPLLTLEGVKRHDRYHHIIRSEKLALGVELGLRWSNDAKVIFWPKYR